MFALSDEAPPSNESATGFQLPDQTLQNLASDAGESRPTLDLSRTSATGLPTYFNGLASSSSSQAAPSTSPLANIGRTPAAMSGGHLRRRPVPGASSLTLGATLLAASTVFGSTLQVLENSTTLNHPGPIASGMENSVNPNHRAPIESGMFVGAASSSELYSRMFSVKGRKVHGFVIDPGAASNLCGTNT